MALESTLRRAKPADAPCVADLLHKMMEEIAPYGRDTLNADDERMAEISRTVQEYLTSDERLVVLAGDGIGMIMARMERLHGIYAPKLLLHISAIWVELTARRRGLGRRLVDEAFTWGRSRGCVEARLNVLVGNPASALYQELGFDVAQVEMRRTI